MAKGAPHSTKGRGGGVGQKAGEGARRVREGGGPEEVKKEKPKREKK